MIAKEFQDAFAAVSDEEVAAMVKRIEDAYADYIMNSTIEGRLEAARRQDDDDERE